MFTKVTNLKIKKLFGFANYNIHFSNDDLTIITGPNGYGKTMILNIIKHILLEEYKKLNEMDFSEIEFTTNKEIILIKKNENKLDISSKYYSDLNNYSENIDFNLNLNEIKTRVKVISLMSSGGISGEKIKKQNENFILKLISFKEKTNNFEEFITNSYKTLKTSMYIKEINHSSLIYDRLFGLQETLKKYNKYGIFDNIKEFIELNKSSNIEISEDIISSFNLIELDEIITESFNYLSELQDYLDRLELFTDIIEEKKFSFKKLHIDEVNGISFINYNNKRIGVEQLSSGEKNKVSMLYELIFEAVDGSIILIDEPEISLHLTWQSQLFSEFEKISKVNDYKQIIIATHSPDVIGEKWNSTIDLYDILK